MTTTENQIEADLVAKLGELKYTYRPDIRDRSALEANFRAKFEALNRVNLTDSEFQRLLDGIITPDVYNSAQTLRHINSFEREDGTPLNYTLVNIRDWCKNDFEVVNQLRINSDNSHHRYDVMLLINGVPVVQIELKALAVSPRRAMQQIVDYKSDPGNGYGKTLLCFVQLFIVSNRTSTWYFANNNTRHFSFNADERFLPVYQFASEDNRKITQLDNFAEKFLAKCTLGQMISRYMVLVASEQKLLMMRPYQIYAVKAIVDCIHQNCGSGYIWHTTGSGKTLTSFKASTLLKDNPDIDKCLFVVDRKDLDRQTREEFNRFQEGCVEENTNTEALVRRLRTTPTRSSSPPSRSWALHWMKTASATSRRKSRARRPTSSVWSRCASNVWCSSSTNATGRSSVRTTRQSRSSFQTPNCSASPARPSSRRTLAINKSRASKPATALQMTCFSAACMSTRLPTPSTIRTF
jgi:type I restriction enzyme R subunit